MPAGANAYTCSAAQHVKTIAYVIIILPEEMKQTLQQQLQQQELQGNS